MRYENRQPPEGINVTDEHPLRRFAVLLVAAVALFALTVVALRLVGGFAAARVPFAFERRVVERTGVDFGDAAAAPALTAYLDGLASALAAEMPVPDAMDVTVHYRDDDTFNAFATLGGHVFLHRGLLERLPHENALAMVLAHEIAHVLHRDPIASLGGGVASAVALAALGGGTGAAGDALARAGALTGVQFTRAMERAADRAALAAVAARYGHVAGADALFRLVPAVRGTGALPERLERFVATHPLDADRVRAIAERAAASGWATRGPTTPLPAAFGAWLGGGGGRRGRAAVPRLSPPPRSSARRGSGRSSRGAAAAARAARPPSRRTRRARRA